MKGVGGHHSSEIYHALRKLHDLSESILEKYITIAYLIDVIRYSYQTNERDEEEFVDSFHQLI